MFRKLFQKNKKIPQTRFFIYKNRFNEVKPYEVNVIFSSERALEVYDVQAQKEKTFTKSNVLAEVRSYNEAVALAKKEQRKYTIKTPKKLGANMGNPDLKPELCFTGFKKADKAEMIKLAQDNGFHVRSSVSKGLTALICGNNAGPAKIKQAKANGAAIINGKDGFCEFLNSGEIHD